MSPSVLPLSLGTANAKCPWVKALKADWFKLGTALLIFKTVLLLIHTSMGMFDNSLIVCLSAQQSPSSHSQKGGVC